MRKTKYAFRVFAIINKANIVELNKKAESHYGRGPGKDFFSRAVTTSAGGAPVAYVASFVCTEREIRLWVKHMLDNYPKSYLYIAARGKFGGTLKKLARRVKVADYRNKAWKTRTKGFAGLVDDNATLEDVLARIVIDSTPSIPLQPVE